MDTLIAKLPWISRTFKRPAIALIGIVCVVLALICGAIALLMRGGVSRTADPNEVVNTTGHYRFDAPTGWTTTQQGRTTTVTSPDQATVITLGVGHAGPIPNAGTQFFQDVASHYK